MAAPLRVGLLVDSLAAPAWVARTVERLAAVRGADPYALGARCIENAAALFGLASVTGPAVP